MTIFDLFTEEEWVSLIAARVSNRAAEEEMQAHDMVPLAHLGAAVLRGFLAGGMSRADAEEGMASIMTALTFLNHGLRTHPRYIDRDHL